MERDLMVMIYGAMMGVVGSILTSIVTAVFQLWLERELIDGNRWNEIASSSKSICPPMKKSGSSIQNDQQPEPTRTLAEAGSVLISVLLSSLVVYQTKDPRLG
jgi:hypothetical protein